MTEREIVIEAYRRLGIPDVGTEFIAWLDAKHPDKIPESNVEKTLPDGSTWEGLIQSEIRRTHQAIGMASMKSGLTVDELVGGGKEAEKERG